MLHVKIVFIVRLRYAYSIGVQLHIVLILKLICRMFICNVLLLLLFIYFFLLNSISFCYEYVSFRLRVDRFFVVYVL